MTTLKVLTFNIHKGLNLSQSELVLPKIKQLLEQIDADVVFLQEVQGVHRKRSKKFAAWPVVTQTEYLAGEYWPHFCYGKNHSHKHGHHGNAILSKFPLSSRNNIDISASRFSHRGLLYAKIEHFSNPLHLICTHLGLLNKERNQQFSALNNFIDEKIMEDEAILMAGDFNDWRSMSLKLLNESIGLKEVFHEIQGGYAKSFPADFPLLKVDRIYYRGMQPRSCNVANVKRVSDHLPLVAKFQLDQG